MLTKADVNKRLPEPDVRYPSPTPSHTPDPPIRLPTHSPHPPTHPPTHPFSPHPPISPHPPTVMRGRSSRICRPTGCARMRSLSAGSTRPLPTVSPTAATRSPR